MSWFCSIEKVDNGYLIEYPEELDNGTGDIKRHVIEENDQDELASHEALLWWLVEYFDFYGSKHDLERIRIVREKHE